MKEQIGNLYRDVGKKELNGNLSTDNFNILKNFTDGLKLEMAEG